MSHRIFNRVSVIVLALGMAAPTLATPSVAQAAEVPALRKLAMVDMQRVLNETKAGRKARKELEESSKSKQSKLEKKQAQLEKDASKLQSLSGQKLAEAQERLQKEYMEVQNMAAALEQELATEHNKLLQKMYENSQSIVAELAQQRGLDLVLVRDQMTVIYAKESFDITDTVVKQYDERHK